MPALIKVYPTKASALSIPAIPGRPKLTVAGVMWPQDSFTARRLTDGSVTTDSAQAYSSAAPAQAAAAAPAPATTPDPSAAAAPANAPAGSVASAPAAPAPTAEPAAK